MQNMSGGKSALGLEGNIAALIGYIIPLVALISVIIEKDNKFVRYHAFQSLLWVVLMIIAVFAIVIVGFIFGFVLSQVSSGLATIVGFLFLLLYIGWFFAYIGGLIYGAIKSYGGSMFKFPVVGNLAEKWSN